MFPVEASNPGEPIATIKPSSLIATLRRAPMLSSASPPTKKGFVEPTVMYLASHAFNVTL
eukprot:scaffold79380_cov93-Phaeocystis_antarctica.AAC.1